MVWSGFTSAISLGMPLRSRMSASRTTEGAAQFHSTCSLPRVYAQARPVSPLAVIDRRQPTAGTRELKHDLGAHQSERVGKKDDYSLVAHVMLSRGRSDNLAGAGDGVTAVRVC